MNVKLPNGRHKLGQGRPDIDSHAQWRPSSGRHRNRDWHLDRYRHKRLHTLNKQGPGRLSEQQAPVDDLRREGCNHQRISDVRHKRACGSAWYDPETAFVARPVAWRAP